MTLTFTGTRAGMTDAQRIGAARFVRETKPREAHHGCCRGADRDFHPIAFTAHPQVRLHLHPVDDGQKDWALRAMEGGFPGHTTLHKRVYGGAHPHLNRNVVMVDNADLVLATPRLMYEEQRSGTWHAIRYAGRQHKKVHIIWPDGTLEVRG